MKTDGKSTQEIGLSEQLVTALLYQSENERQNRQLGFKITEKKKSN